MPHSRAPGIMGMRMAIPGLPGMKDTPLGMISLVLKTAFCLTSKRLNAKLHDLMSMVITCRCLKSASHSQSASQEKRKKNKNCTAGSSLVMLAAVILSGIKTVRKFVVMLTIYIWIVHLHIYRIICCNKVSRCYRPMPPSHGCRGGTKEGLKLVP